MQRQCWASLAAALLCVSSLLNDVISACVAWEDNRPEWPKASSCNAGQACTAQSCRFG